MKIAVEMSGQPRFTEDLTSLVRNIGAATTVDYFCHFWNKNDPPDKPNEPEAEYIHPLWRYNPDPVWAWSVIEKNLPQNHYLRRLEFSTQLADSEIPNPNHQQHVYIGSVWRMWDGWKIVSEYRQEYEKQHGSYDIVIKGRPDAGFSKMIDFSRENTSVITSCNTQWHGFSKTMNDVIFYGNSQNMALLANLMEKSLTYGITFHPETVLAHHFNENNVQCVKGNWAYVFRTKVDGKVVWGNWI